MLPKLHKQKTESSERTSQVVTGYKTDLLHLMAGVYPKGIMTIDTNINLRYIEIKRKKYIYKRDICDIFNFPYMFRAGHYSSNYFRRLCEANQIKCYDLRVMSPSNYQRIPKHISRLTWCMVESNDVKKLYSRYKRCLKSRSAATPRDTTRQKPTVCGNFDSDSDSGVVITQQDGEPQADVIEPLPDEQEIGCVFEQLPVFDLERSETDSDVKSKTPEVGAVETRALADGGEGDNREVTAKLRDITYVDVVFSADDRGINISHHGVGFEISQVCSVASLPVEQTAVNSIHVGESEPEVTSSVAETGGVKVEEASHVIMAPSSEGGNANDDVIEILCSDAEEDEATMTRCPGNSSTPMVSVRTGARISPAAMLSDISAIANMTTVEVSTLMTTPHSSTVCDVTAAEEHDDVGGQSSNDNAMAGRADTPVEDIGSSGNTCVKCESQQVVEQVLQSKNDVGTSTELEASLSVPFDKTSLPGLRGKKEASASVSVATQTAEIRYGDVIEIPSSDSEDDDTASPITTSTVANTVQSTNLLDEVIELFSSDSEDDESSKRSSSNASDVITVHRRQGKVQSTPTGGKQKVTSRSYSLTVTAMPVVGPAANVTPSAVSKSIKTDIDDDDSVRCYDAGAGSSGCCGDGDCCDTSGAARCSRISTDSGLHVVGLLQYIRRSFLFLVGSTCIQ